MFSAIFGHILLLSYFFDLSIWKFVFKRFISIQQKILEARFSPPNSTFYSPFASHMFSILSFSGLTQLSSNEASYLEYRSQVARGTPLRAQGP